MRIIPMVLLVAGAASGAGAQSAAETAAPTDGPVPCADELEWAVAFARINYAGFETKTAGDRLAAHDELVAELREAAAGAADPAACDEVLRAWASFFHDGHLSVGRRSADAGLVAEELTPAAIRARFADWPRVEPATEPEARRLLDALGEDRAAIEGVWESDTGAYRVAVLRDPDVDGRYIMSILRADSVWWVPGEVKAIFQAADDGGYDVRFFMRDHSEQRWTGEVQDNVLVMERSSVWFRTWPRLAADVDPDAYFESRNRRFRVRDAGDGTVVIHIPSFENTPAMDSLFEAEGDRVRGAERLVVDLRGNGGGSDYNFRALIPLVYTGPIRLVSNEMLATEANIRANERLTEDQSIPPEVREILARQVEEMRASLGGWHPFPDRVEELPDVLARPARIAVLVDGGCASSCEQFLLAARQSSKVTLYGWPTAGILDFGNVRRADMPDGSLVLYYPTTRSKRLPHAPVDGVGIHPDVPVPDDEPDSLRWVIDHLQSPASQPGAADRRP